MRRFTRFQQAVVVLLVVIVAVAGFTFLFGAKSSPQPKPVDTSGARGTVAESALPPQAQQTIDRINAGGPFPFSRDGVVFNNREGLLPIQPSGYYHEFTVPTPGSSDRGARRIVNGSGGFFFYSADHYRTFRQIVLSSR